MSRRFALPIAITLSAHAILLLGSSRPVSHPIPKTKEDVGCACEIVPVKDVEVDDANDTEMTKGSKDIEAPPSLPPPTGGCLDILGSLGHLGVIGSKDIEAPPSLPPPTPQ